MLATRAVRESATAEFLRAKKKCEDAINEHSVAQMGLRDARANLEDVQEKVNRAIKDKATALAARDDAVARAIKIRHGAPQGMSIALDEMIAAFRDETQTTQVVHDASAHLDAVFALLPPAQAEVLRWEHALYAADAALDAANITMAMAREQLDTAISVFETVKWECDHPPISSTDEMEPVTDSECRFDRW